MYSVDWKTIRPWNGSQSGGFEEMCAQLARIETLDSAKFTRTGTPDAGVECYCILPDGDEWGWQAKYFTSPLTNTQWQQLDGSIRTALDKHPRLVRYHVCIPRDRSDARMSNQTSEMDRWNDRVAKWEGWARERGMDVEFEWWGSSELIDRLSREEHTGHRFFWFGQHEFSRNWFGLHLDESVNAAGARYTPEVHVDLPIAQKMERFSRSLSSFEEVKSLSLGVRRAHDNLVFTQRSSNERTQEMELDSLLSATSSVLDALALLEASPAGYMGYSEVAKAADDACKEGVQVQQQIRQLQREERANTEDASVSSSYRMEPLRDILSYVLRLQMALQEVAEDCINTHSLANSQLLLLRGDGGTGKTHLLCDFATRRVQAHLPTLLMMGERFLSGDDPWTQLLQQLDLTQCSAEEFVGALESAAEASGCRALVMLVMIDALNEGNGRKIWPAHLPSFLARLEKSPWIGVVLSVRSSYEEVVIRESVREKAAIVTHHGFTGHEFDATRIYFAHHGLESPSTPILQPEFSNPLFLKAICKGLEGRGEHRLPKGFHGITSVFELYLEAIHGRLWKPESLDYGPNDNLVRQALQGLAGRLAEYETRRLPRPEAQTIVNSLLPGRDYSRSLYAALVAEGILTEDMETGSCGNPEEMVSITYDRFADHIISDHLLNAHLDPDDPYVAFSKNGGLAFLGEKEQYVRYGLIEALCVQVPERTGKELVRLAPNVLNRPNVSHAFLQSIMWRKHDAISDDTLEVLDDFIQRESIWEELLDTVVSLSAVPGHPLNADSLDRRLRQDSMPDRDSWWSTYLHRAWGAQSPVDRLIDWASNLSRDDHVEDEVVDLAATTLAWMLTTPNRFLRDRATKALVSLLTGRFESAEQLVNRFADVDDPYVSERVYAVAYGVAMQGNDPDAVGKLASVVYERVFTPGSPPPHILLRDYARGVVERAIHLGADIPVDVSLIRPPYKSIWPSIPSEKVVEALTPNLNQGAWEGGDLEWSRNRIRHSVMGDILNDFARYVIGTESEPYWLSLRLDEDRWPSPQERLEALLRSLSDAERVAYEEFERIEKEPLSIVARMRLAILDDEHEAQLLSKEVKQHEQRIEASRRLLMSTLTETHKSEMESILQAKPADRPRFDVRKIQRYVMWRVFDLGWTIERFGKFDRFTIGLQGREAQKPERMGKKYQWIAYHEILAYLSDHFQYREPYFNDEGDSQYEGPWQLHVRDIDPSCVLRSTPGGTYWGPRRAAWWGDVEYAAWADELGHQDWLALETDTPDVEVLLQVDRPEDGSHWINVCGHVIWSQSHAVDVDPFEIERRQLGLQWNAYFVRSGDVDSFMDWVNSSDLPLSALPEPPSTYLYYMFFGEYGWSPAFGHQFSDPNSAGGWAKPEGEEWPVEVRQSTVSYTSESGVFDCSVDDNFTLHLPHPELLSDLGIRWSGRFSDFLDERGKLAVFDPTAHQEGPTALLISEELIEQLMEEKGLVLCWVVYGEKVIVGGEDPSEFQGRLKISGAYRYTDQGAKGCLRFSLDLPERVDP